MVTSSPDVQATFCATLVEEWVRCGVEHAVVSPGSRSTPLALALAAEDRLTLHVHHDERSAGFLALGIALATHEPAIVLTTSGTAAVELHPAVVEADLAGVAMLVCTANRPPELAGIGAPQAIDQTHLFGRSVRWFGAPGVADADACARWRPLAGRAYAEATGTRSGPVHLDLAFREPLLGEPGELPEGRPGGGPWVWRTGPQAPRQALIDVQTDLQGQRGVILAGPGSGDGDAVAAIAEALGWPVLASPSAPVWSRPDVVVPAADALLRVAELHDELNPQVLLHLGLPLASRVVGEWAAGTGATHLALAGSGRWVDPHGVAAVVLDDDVDAVLEAWRDQTAGIQAVDGGAWRDRWTRLGQAARAAIDRVLTATPELSEPGAVAAVVESIPQDGELVVSSSMPVRDLEWYVPSRPGLRVHANRGANGIDGVVSTAVGVAAGSLRPTGLLIGDIAFLHDSNGLLGATGRGIDLVVVVVDNDGGGIFSFLPQAETVADERFERLFGTPHGLDLTAIAAAYGAHVAEAHDADSLTVAVADGFARGGVHVVVVRTDRSRNRALHAALNAAVADAVRPLAAT